MAGEKYAVRCLLCDASIAPYETTKPRAVICQPCRKAWAWAREKYQHEVVIKAFMARKAQAAETVAPEEVGE